MAKVTYDDRSFLLDGKRIWLTSGSVHYFRIPQGLWRDRLLKAKRCGLNCIDVYIAWNFHEPAEGKWELTGDHDVAAFIKLAGELGLYVILRPGPYICAEWDFGGLPSWLTTKSGMAFRTNNASFMHYFDRYFRQVLPRLAEMQVTRGGNIVLVQNENEYYMTTMPDRLAYMEFISQLLLRSGFEVPIITCNLLTDPPVPGAIECVNSWARAVPQLKRLRTRQPNAPMLVTEFWPGWFDHWGAKHETRDDREVARRAMEILGCGSQLNYYMWHGGTNFGFWGARMVANDACYQTTSYDYDAPLSETGGLTRKYYLTKLVNMLANHMGQHLAACRMVEPGVTVQDSANVYNISGPSAQWAFISNGGRDEIKAVTITLPQGKELAVNLEFVGATAVPVGIQLTDAARLDYSTLMPLGFFHDRNLVLHGMPGWAGKVSINGREQTISVPKGDEVVKATAGDINIFVINSELATRTWLAENSLALGPIFVGETLSDVQIAPGSRDYQILAPEGNLSKKKIPARPSHAHAMPKLAPFKQVAACTEPEASDLAWQKIGKPTDVDSLGVHHGYIWYKVELGSAKAARRHLFLPECGDRATMWLNGQKLAVWGRGAGATRKPVAASLDRGVNTLTILLDNMGRLNYGPNIGELKGVYGHIYDAREIKLAKPKIARLETFAKRVIPRRLAYLQETLEQLPCHVIPIDLTLAGVSPVHVAFADVPHHVAVVCNDRPVEFFAHLGANWGDVTLTNELQKGRNRVELMLWGQADPDVMKKFHVYQLGENLTAGANWSIRPWARPSQGHGGAHATKPAPAKSRSAGAAALAAWYASSFHYRPSGIPLMLRIEQGKGQIFLNGRNLGRFWQIGPQELYYLPESWLTEENDLLLFEETGSGPGKCSLEFRNVGPYDE